MCIYKSDEDIINMDPQIKNIISYLKTKRGFDFSGNRTNMLKRRIKNRLSAVKCADFKEYLGYIKEHSDELNNLIDVLTINVSSFFRETFTFEYIAAHVLPDIVQKKKDSADRMLRVWSAGCAKGEEPYSIAILIKELIKKDYPELKLNIFATDIDKKNLEKAEAGVYSYDSIKSIKYRFAKKHFTIENENYILNSDIKKMVDFSFYDLLDKKTSSPPESVFGNFDLILCRNVLIYFHAKHQQIIFDKLYRSLAKGGYLVLGEAEEPVGEYQKYFKKEHKYWHLYRKAGDRE